MREQLIAPLVLVRTQLRKREFKDQLAKSKQTNGELKVVIGASGISETGWLATEYGFLNILLENDWLKYFERESIDRMMAEHVWEHMTTQDGLIAAKNCFKFLKNGASIRIAVPDGHNPNQNYIDAVKPNGFGRGAKDHKVLYTHKSLCRLFELAGFEVNFLEHFDEAGKFHFETWNPEDGLIRRSLNYDQRNIDGMKNYTSLIIDAKKVKEVEGPI
jgi:predicted SAM-dependent methyltransferase